MNNKSIALFTALFTLFASYLSAAAPENNPTTFRNFELGGGITNVFQRSSSANRTFSPEGQASEVSWSFDLELSGIVGEHGKFFALYEAGLGEGIDAKFTGYSGFNGDANDQGKLSSTEIWYEYQKNEKSFRFRLGKIDFSSDFDTSSFANCEVEQFISSAFVNNLTLEFPEK
ncbi:MAG: hypothetical protein EOM59_14770, partial [Clostridia bacterium]|nr:hypothetical protein [Clostridia bacterium]